MFKKSVVMTVENIKNEFWSPITLGIPRRQEYFG